LPSSKSTVVGVRLDHERRAWLESEAARQGVTLRVLVERMIDQGRADEGMTTPDIGSADGSESASAPVGPVRRNGTGEGITDNGPATRDLGPRPQPRADVMPLTELPGEVIRTGISLTRTIVTSGGDFAVSTLRSWSSRVPVCRRPR
jgi:hypothetical protein